MSEMSDLMVASVDQAAVLLKPLRVEILRLLVEPRSCPELAEALGLSMQKAYYHVKVLEKSGLVRKVGERRARAIMEGIYQASARSVWLSPRVTRMFGGVVVKAREQFSLGLIQGMGEELLTDISQLASCDHEITAAGLSGRVELHPSDRVAFLAELQQAVQALAEKYGATGAKRRKAQALKLLLACYEEPQTLEDNNG